MIGEGGVEQLDVGGLVHAPPEGPEAQVTRQLGRRLAFEGGEAQLPEVTHELELVLDQEGLRGLDSRGDGDAHVAAVPLASLGFGGFHEQGADAGAALVGVDVEGIDIDPPQAHEVGIGVDVDVAPHQPVALGHQDLAGELQVGGHARRADPVHRHRVEVGGDGERSVPDLGDTGKVTEGELADLHGGRGHGLQGGLL
ncbi:hypothetical protein D3C72_1680020 [compost metagenome]